MKKKTKKKQETQLPKYVMSRAKDTLGPIFVSLIQLYLMIFSIPWHKIHQYIRRAWAENH